MTDARADNGAVWTELHTAVIDAPAGARQVRTILHWRRHDGLDAHCLARLLLPAHPGRPVAVISEIASNPDGRGISDDFANLADAFLTRLTSQQPLVPEEIVWLAHHGEFSYYDPGGPETFTAVPLRWDGHHYHDDLHRHRLLTSPEVGELLAGWDLKPVPGVLDDLHWRP